METKTPAKDAVGRANVDKAIISAASSKLRIEWVLIFFSLPSCPSRPASMWSPGSSRGSGSAFSDSSFLVNINTPDSDGCVVWAAKPLKAVHEFQSTFKAISRPPRPWSLVLESRVGTRPGEKTWRGRTCWRQPRRGYMPLDTLSLQQLSGGGLGTMLAKLTVKKPEFLNATAMEILWALFVAATFGLNERRT